MNIFITDKSPLKCAEYLDDKRVIKMALESTQILCTAANTLAGYQITPYKSTHKHHPCVRWAMESKANWLWLFTHAVFLCREYEERYGKKHKCLSVLEEIVDPISDRVERLFIVNEPTPFVNCARNKTLGIDYTDEEDVFNAYRLYLADRWELDKRTPTWNGVGR